MIDLDHFLLEFEEKGFYLAEGLIAREHAQELRDKILRMSAKESAAGEAYIYPHDPNAKTQRIWNLTNKHKCFRDLIEINSLYVGPNTVYSRWPWRQWLWGRRVYMELLLTCSGI